MSKLALIAALVLGLGSMARADDRDDGQEIQDQIDDLQAQLDTIKAEHQFDVDRSGYDHPTGWAKGWVHSDRGRHCGRKH
jgi:hypothetical protein